MPDIAPSMSNAMQDTVKSANSISDSGTSTSDVIQDPDKTVSRTSGTMHARAPSTSDTIKDTIKTANIITGKILNFAPSTSRARVMQYRKHS
jgi:hypothetical protein